MTDESKNIVVAAAYEPFGESTVTGEESYLYTGKQKDTTGLYYYGARYYDPDLGRFMTRDPFMGIKTNPQSLNRYTYCLNNPVKLVDPAGLTYRMCDVNTGVCVRVFEGGRDGWAAYDENGNYITDSNAMETLFTQAKNAESDTEREYILLQIIVRILRMLGFDVSDNDINPEKLRIEFDIDGVETWVNVILNDPTERRGLTTQTKKGKPIKIDIYFGPIGGKNWTFEELFHSVGHEIIHARHKASGNYYKWERKYNSDAVATYLSEALAYQWNLRMLYLFNFPGALEMFYQGWLKNVTAFLRHKDR